MNESVRKILNFFGTPVTVNEGAENEFYSVEEAYDQSSISYYWVMVTPPRDPEARFTVKTYDISPHIGFPDTQLVGEADLEEAVMKAFKLVNWNFPTRPENVQEWSDLG